MNLHVTFSSNRFCERITFESTPPPIPTINHEKVFPFCFMIRSQCFKLTVLVKIEGAKHGDECLETVPFRGFALSGTDRPYLLLVFSLDRKIFQLRRKYVVAVRKSHASILIGAVYVNGLRKFDPLPQLCRIDFRTSVALKINYFAASEQMAECESLRIKSNPIFNGLGIKGRIHFYSGISSKTKHQDYKD